MKTREERKQIKKEKEMKGFYKSLSGEETNIVYGDGVDDVLTSLLVTFLSTTAILILIICLAYFNIIATSVAVIGILLLTVVVAVVGIFIFKRNYSNDKFSD